MAKTLQPQKGAQEAFLASPADVVIYGGSAGSGKSFATLLDAVRYKNVKGFGAVIFRQNHNQIFAQGGLWDTAQEVYGGIKNAVPRIGASAWSFFENKKEISRISFAHIEADRDLPKWQGSQICCTLDTPVLMADGTYKNVADIKIGDYVATLEGSRRVVDAGTPRIAECVEIECNGHKQTQTTNHSILTESGWLAFDDFIEDSERLKRLPIQCYSVCKCGVTEMENSPLWKRLLSKLHLNLRRANGFGLNRSRKFYQCGRICNRSEKDFSQSIQCHCSDRHVGYYARKFRVFRKLLEIRQRGYQPKALLCQPMCQAQDLQETFACKALKGRDSFCELFRLKRPKDEQRISDHLAQERFSQEGGLSQDSAFLHVLACDELPCVPHELQASNLQGRYSRGSCLCGGLVQKIKGIFRAGAPSQGDVEEQSRKDLREGARGKAPIYSRSLIRYVHPYTGKERFGEVEHISRVSFLYTSVGKRAVRSLTIDSVSHYITMGGFVNRNCGEYYDELTHFSEKQFFYMLSRNRSTCGVRPYVRATCNPDADSWVAKFIEWWIDQETGYPIQERSGIIRYMMRREDVIYWGDTKEELWEKFNLTTPEEKEEPKSVTFIAATIYDNQILIKNDPSYLANLKALPEVERERLLCGNWKIKPAAGLFFKRIQIGAFLEVVPADVVSWCRGWDLAATAEDEGGEPAYTAGVLMGKRKNGRYIIADVKNVRMSAGDVRQLIKHTAQQDNAMYKRVTVRLPQDPAQAGKDQAQSFIKYLSGFNVYARKESGNKALRAEPVAAQWQAGNFDILIGDWNDTYLSQLESFPQSKFKDMVDATSSAFNELEEHSFDISNLIK